MLRYLGRELTTLADVFDPEFMHQRLTRRLALRGARGAIDRILGSIAPVGEPEWHVKAPFTEKTLIDTECIWPDGRPQQSPTSIDRQSPFHPQIRNARIVRQDRRQFRVYDGGLDKPDNKI